MKLVRLWKAALAVGVLSACVFGLAACSGNDPNSGVAATVNGVEISEQKVTDTVQHVRDQSGLSDDEQWGKFLVQNDMTPESVRSTNIDTLVDQEIIKQGASDLGIEVDSSEVQEAIDSFKENYSDDEKWQDALEKAGFTEESYYEDIEESMIEQKVGDHFEELAEVTDDDYVQSAKTYASYYDGAKHVSKILIVPENADDEESVEAAKAQAQSIIDQVNGGMDFAEAARQYSADEDTKENGGDIGWDKLESFDDDITDALTGMEAGQVSDVIETSDGLVILKVTEKFTAPEEDAITSLDQIPEAFQENIKQMAVSVKANTLYSDWLEGLKDEADIQINDMPSGLPYDIDLTPYQEDEGADDAAADADSLADTTTTDDATVDVDTADATATTGDTTASDTTEATATADSTTAEATDASSDASTASQ